MARSIKILLLCFMAAFLVLGMTYASWNAQFSVFTDIDTYDFDLTVNNETMNSQNAVESKFKLNEDIVLDIVNKGSVGAYIKKVVIRVERSNDAGAANDMRFAGEVVSSNNRDAGIYFTGESFYENSPLTFRFASDSHLIEPISVNGGGYEIEIDKSISITEILAPLRTIKKDFSQKKESLSDDISVINNQITNYENEMSILKTESESVGSVTAEGSEYTTDEKQLQIDEHMAVVKGLEGELLKLKQSIREINEKIDSITDEIDEKLYSYENDEIIITTYFEIFND